MACRIKDLSSSELIVRKEEYLWHPDICKGYCLLALKKASLSDHQILELMDILESELCNVTSPEDALKELSEYEFALSDWHC